jgi:predicted nucleic acid-binding protein
VLYLDSSALIKHYQLEGGRSRLEAKLKEATNTGTSIFSSVLTYAEIHAVLARRNRERNISEPEAKRVHDQFDEDWIFTLSPVDATAGVLGFVREIVKNSPLKGADALHLASALWLRDMSIRRGKHGDDPKSLVFISSDKQLLTAAEKNSLRVFDPGKS